MLNLLSNFQSVMSTIGRVLLAFVILMFMILIHETGHYLSGKLLKFKINEFAVGMGPKILSKKKKNGEIVSLRLLPLGGFCAFEGEDGETKTEGAFNAQKPWKRLIVLFSGAFFNFVSAVLICVFLFGFYGETVATVNTVYDYAPSMNRQLQAGDIIYKINGKKVFMLDGLSRYMSDEMDIVVLRGGKEIPLKGVTLNDYCSVSIQSLGGHTYVSTTDGKRELEAGDMIYRIYDKNKPAAAESNSSLISAKGDFDAKLLDIEGDTCIVTIIAPTGYDDDGNYDGTYIEYSYEIPTSELKAALNYSELTQNELETATNLVIAESEYNGIGMSISYIAYKFPLGTAISRVLPYCGEVAMLVLRTLGGLFTGAVGLNDIGGPITTISMTSQVVSYGFASVLALIVLISVNLAVFNLLPVPALDGCRMVFVLIEWIAGRPINRKVEAWINTVGLILLLGFVILVDLLKL